MQQRNASGVRQGALATGIAVLLVGVVQSASGEQTYGVEVLPVVEAQAEAEPESALGEPPGGEAEPGGDEVVLVIDAAATTVTIEYELPRPGVTVRGWEPGAPSQIRVIGAETRDSSRIPVRGWDPGSPQRLRVHSWIAGMP